MGDQFEAWLLDSDPALRWQIECDVLGTPRDRWEATRARVATEGLGVEVLSHQDPEGTWAGGAFFPAGWAWDNNKPQPWTTTTWALKDLREWGLDARVLDGTAEKLDKITWEYDDLPYWHGEVDCCINSWTLSNGLWLGADVDGIVTWFLDHQLPDGGWNCAWTEGSVRSSFHSTLNALIGLLDYQLATGDPERVREARRGGEEYLLERSLFRRLSTREPVFEQVLRLTHPRRAYYNVLAAADYFRAACLADGAQPDARMTEAIQIIRSQRRPDGTWLQGHRLPGDVWVHIDSPAGEPSKWVTFQALRVLDWWDRPRD
ncbi:prenyltransferase/squalene oxidase repeat-containing protein [Psychromicrobium xiongbiense]|uniref:prenyltransferase/squalene oxidase repeat-containing protein n=1 Tax=Psychromicrobium xiongbiense TaxID=3051184 RepID=UPI0025560144|nr:prenyltransferase/squalene oxidase repeat-containing protein [Psychromicrobium sp. YIM S02556]